MYRYKEPILWEHDACTMDQSYGMQCTYVQEAESYGYAMHVQRMNPLGHNECTKDEFY